MSSYLNYTIKEFLIESFDGKNYIDASRCVASIQYFEDLFSPAIFVSMELVNTDGLLTSLRSEDPSITPGIKGGERVRLVIDQSATKSSIEFTETKNTYYIYKVHTSTSESTREVFFIELAPAEVFTNETSRVFRRYPESSGTEQRIDISVNKILTEVLTTTRVKPENIERTLNSYAFFGNSRKPFTVLTWLCPKAIPPLGTSGKEFGTAGFLFYENKNGYNFKSIDGLLSKLSPGTADQKSIQSYSYTELVNSAATTKDNFKILKMPVFEKNVNIYENLRMGMYSSVNYFFDINTRKFNSYTYKLSESYDIMVHSSTNNEKPRIPIGLENSPSRLMVKTVDNLVGTPLKGEVKERDLKPQYQAQSIARYNLAFSQMLNITIPLNLTLTVGDVIQINFGTTTTIESKQGTKDTKKSGYYLIKELSHLFSSGKGYTGLKLIRDSYGK